MNQVKAGIVLNYSIIILNLLLGLLYTPFMLRMLGQNEYGLYSLVASIIAYLTLLDFGFGSAIVRYTAKYISENKIKEQWELNGMFLAVYTVIGLIAMALGFILYNNIDWLFEKKMSVQDLNQARKMVALLILNLTLTFPLSIFGSIISAYQDFIFQKLLTIGRLIFSTLVIIGLLLLGYKAVAMVVIQTVFNLGVLFINCIYCFKKLKIQVRFSNFNYRLLKEIIIFSFWVFLSQIIDRLYFGTGQFVLGSTIGTTAVAIFSVAILLQHMYITFSNSFTNVLLPKLTMLANKEETDNEISNLFIKTGRIQSLIMTFILTGFLVFGQSFIILWAGENYKESYLVTLILFTASFIPTIQTTGYVILMARNKMKFRSLVYLCIAIISLIFQIILSKEYGTIGCAVAVGGGLIIGHGFIMNYYYWKHQSIRIDQFWKEIFKLLIAPIIITGIFCYLKNFYLISNYKDLFLGIFLFCVVYCPAVYFFSMNKYEKNLIKTLPRKFKAKFNR